MGQRPARHQPKKPRQPQVRNDDHHAKQECERVEVDRAISLLRRNCADRHHQRRASERNAGAIKPEPGNASERNARISQKKDNDGGESVGVFISRKPLIRDVRSFNHGVGDGEQPAIEHSSGSRASPRSAEGWCMNSAGGHFKHALASAVRGTTSGNWSSWPAAPTMRGACRSQPPGCFPARPSAARRSR